MREDAESWSEEPSDSSKGLSLLKERGKNGRLQGCVLDYREILRKFSEASESLWQSKSSEESQIARRLDCLSIRAALSTLEERRASTSM